MKTVQAWRTVNKQITCGVIRPYLHSCPNMVTRWHVIYEAKPITHKTATYRYRVLSLIC